MRPANALDRRPVVVAGVGETGPRPEDPRSIPEMVLEAVTEALADARLGYGDIDAVVTASVDLFDGLTASNIAVTEVVGAVMRPETRIAGDGLAAALHAACQIWAGAYDTVLVAAHGKASMSCYQDLTRWALDPILVQPLGLDFLACSGLQASAMAVADPGAERRWAETAAVRRAACATDAASPCTAEAVLESAVAAAPIREGMCAPMADGATAVVLRTVAPAGKGEDVRLAGVGCDLDRHALGDRDLCAWRGLERAAERAYAGAGVADPEDAFDLAEPSCRCAHEEELFLAATGVGAGTLVSPSGGLFAGDVPVAAGLSRLVAAVRHMRGDAGCRRALAHGAWGPAGQAHVVAVLDRGTA